MRGSVIWANDFNVWMIDYLYCLLREICILKEASSLQGILSGEISPGKPRPGKAAGSLGWGQKAGLRVSGQGGRAGAKVAFWGGVLRAHSPRRPLSCCRIPGFLWDCTGLTRCLCREVRRVLGTHPAPLPPAEQKDLVTVSLGFTWVC